MRSTRKNVPSVRVGEVADAYALGRLHVAAWHETYKGLVPNALLAGLCPKERGAAWQRILRNPASYHNSRVHIAESDAQMVGFAACATQSDEAMAVTGFDGEIGAIYVLRARQRRGIGRLLMRTAAADLRSRGLRSASLWVLRENQSARQFYEHLGGIAVGEKCDVRPEGTLIEIAYGWRDLRLLD